MHDGEVDIDLSLVQRLVTAQFPDLAHLTVAEVHSTGTVNAIYRLGEGLCVRLPRVAHWAGDLEREWRWLPVLADHLPLRIPKLVGKGMPTSSYPFSWAVYDWIDGSPYSAEVVADERQAAVDLAHFVRELRRIDPVGVPPAGRRPLPELDDVTRTAIDAARDVIDRDAATSAWEIALRAPAWSGTPVWIHADLMGPNVLIAEGRVHAVIDWGAAGAGDPAADVIPAWEVFGPDGRRAFRDALDVDDALWSRARGYALHQAALIIPYYRETNPGFVAVAQRSVEQVLVDLDARA